MTGRIAVTWTWLRAYLQARWRGSRHHYARGLADFAALNHDLDIEFYRELRKTAPD